MLANFLRSLWLLQYPRWPNVRQLYIYRLRVTTFPCTIYIRFRLRRPPLDLLSPYIDIVLHVPFSISHLNDHMRLLFIRTPDIKHSPLGIWPWALGYQDPHSTACIRWEMAGTYNRYKFVAISLLKRLRGGLFNSETAARRFQKQNRHLDPEAVYTCCRRLEPPSAFPVHVALKLQFSSPKFEKCPFGSAASYRKLIGQK